MIADPRTFPAASPAADDVALYALAEACLAADTGRQSDAIALDVRAVLERRLRGAGDALAATLDGVPSVAVARLLWRTLDTAWREATLGTQSAVAVTMFALPLVIVVGVEGAEGKGSVAGVLPDAAAVTAILSRGGCLGANQSLALADVLAGPEAIEAARLPQLLAMQGLLDAFASGSNLASRGFTPAPMAFQAGGESVHLRFLLGVALAKAGIDLLTDSGVGQWGLALTRELARQLGTREVPVAALPRAPQNPLRALQQGRIAQREIAAQLFVGNALRRLRARVGEPVAVVSAHRTAEAPAGGELRLSLSSPLEPRDAEGFRCPLYALDRIDDVVAMLADLLRDCRVSDVRVLRGVYPDRVPGSGVPLLFKPDTIPDDEAGILH